MKVSMVTCITFIFVTQVWGKTFLIETKGVDSVPHDELEAGQEYSEDEEEPRGYKEHKEEPSGYKDEEEPSGYKEPHELNS